MHTPSGRWSQAVGNLSAWFQSSARDLPWRREPTPYRVWVSELMLQQTQVATVLGYFERWMRRFPDPQTLADAPLEDVLAHWSGLGYYRRARSLHSGARHWMDHYGADAVPPPETEAWLDFPGVGPYTAGAIVSIAYNRVAPIVDGNVERVLSRVLGHTPEVKKLWRWSAVAVQAAQRRGVAPRVFNQALMELGARVCTPGGAPLCRECPLAAICVARIQGTASGLPLKRARAPTLQIQERVLWQVVEGRVRLVRGGGTQKWRQGLWDLPPLEALFPVHTPASPASLRVHYVVTRHRVEREVMMVASLPCGTPMNSMEEKWVPVADLERWCRLRRTEASPLPIGSALMKSVLAVCQEGLG